MEKREKVPIQGEYKSVLISLIESGSIKTLIAVRMGAEMGMSRIEIVNTRISDLDRFHKRGLWIEIAKKVRRGYKKRKNKEDRKIPNYKMRSREIPVNLSLYQLLKTSIREGQVFLVTRNDDKGDPNKPLSRRYINTLYESSNISWSPHKSRHYFKSKIWSDMQSTNRVDKALLQEFMGHKKDTTDDYGEYSWDYKLGRIDEVFQ